MDDSAITCDEIIEAEIKTVTTIFNEKKCNLQDRKFLFFLAFLLITIALLMAISIYCYLIKY